MLLLLIACLLSLVLKKKLANDIVEEDVDGLLMLWSLGEEVVGDVIKGNVGKVFKNHAPDFFQISRVSEQILQK